jgi:hypothetical protein
VIGRESNAEVIGLFVLSADSAQSAEIHFSDVFIIPIELNNVSSANRRSFTLLGCI